MRKQSNLKRMNGGASHKATDPYSSKPNVNVMEDQKEEEGKEEGEA